MRSDLEIRRKEFKEAARKRWLQQAQVAWDALDQTKGGLGTKGGHKGERPTLPNACKLGQYLKKKKKLPDGGIGGLTTPKLVWPAD